MNYCLFLFLAVGLQAQTNQLIITDTEGTNTVDFTITTSASDEYLYGTISISNSVNGGPFVRSLIVNAFGSGALLAPNFIGSVGASGVGMYLLPNGSLSSTAGTMGIFSSTHTTSSPIYYFDGAPVGTNNQQVIVDMRPSIMQSGTAGYTVLRLETLTTSNGTGNKRLLDFGANGLKGNVNTNGDMVLNGSSTAKMFMFPDGTSLQSIGRVLYYVTSSQTNVVSDGR